MIVRKVYISLLLALMCVMGCSRHSDGPSLPDRPDRPGTEVVPKAPASVHFAAAELVYDFETAMAEGRIEALVNRSGSWLPDTTYAIAVADPRGAITTPVTAHFGPGITAATAIAPFSLTLADGETYSASLSVSAAADSSASVLPVVFRRHTLWQDAGEGTYRTGNTLLHVKARSRASDDGAVEYELTAEGFTRTFTLNADGHISMTSQPAGISEYTTATHSCDWHDDAFKARFAIYSTASHYDSDNRCYLLNITYSGGTEAEPRCDVVRLCRDADPQWIYAGEAEFTDGWLTQIISFEGRPPLVPEENSWRVEIQQFRSNPNHIRAVGLYKVASPLAALNAEPQLHVLPISIDRVHGRANIEPRYSGFDVPGLFASPFVIGGAGSVETDADGCTVLTFEQPLHNGYGTYGSCWNNVHSSVARLLPQE